MSSKIDSLPDDLRSIAIQMLRKKFPEPYTSTTNPGGSLTMESLEKAIKAMKEQSSFTPEWIDYKKRQEVEMDWNKLYMCDWSNGVDFSQVTEVKREWVYLGV